MASRGERMQQRMRGAGIREDVATEFAPLFALPAPASSASPDPETNAPATKSPPKRTIPNTSAKRKRLDGDPTPTSTLSRPGAHTLARPSHPRPRQSDPYNLAENTTAGEETEAPRPTKTTTPRKSINPRINETRVSKSPSQGRPIQPARAVEITESPAEAPGSGRRRTIRSADAASSAHRLQQSLIAPEAAAEEEQSPSRRAKAGESSEEASEAEHVDDHTAARVLSRNKRKRRVEPPHVDVELEQDGEDAPVQPAAKQRRQTRLANTTPAKQRPPPKPQRKPVRAREAGDGSDSKRGPPVSITVQRFKEAMPAEDEDGVGETAVEVPFSNRKDANAIDVLAQLCEEVIDSSIEKLHNRAQRTEHAADRRAFKVQRAALEALREEIKSQLLLHTIALDAWHSLNQRVHAAQKERAALRERVIGIKVEREQVALRKDAVRIKHERDQANASYELDLSSAMHDIDLAIENGCAGPALTINEAKLAKLANLDFLIAKVKQQTCASEANGGILDQVRDFNAFLERTAAAL